MKTIQEKEIPIMEGNYKPSMAEISYDMDCLLKLSEAGDQDAGELYRRLDNCVYDLREIHLMVENWAEFKKQKEIKEKAEVLIELWIKNL